MALVDVFPGMSNPRQSGSSKYYLPIQTVDQSVKNTDDWQHECMDFLSTMWLSNSMRRREKIVNYKLVNGEFVPELYNSINSFTEGMDLGELNKPIKHYPILNLPLKDLWGEETKRPFVFKAKAEDEENKNEYLRYKSELLQQYVVSNIQNKINESLKEKGLDPNSKEGEEAAQSMTPPEIEIFMKRKYSTTVEKAANSILNKLMKQLLLKEKFSKGWKDATICAEEYYWIGTINDTPVLETVNPISIVYDKTDQLDYIDQADWVTRGEYMTKSQIIDRYRDFLSDDQVKAIETYDRNGGTTQQVNNSTIEAYTEQGYPYLYGGSNDSKYPISPDYRIFEFTPSGNQYNYNNQYGYRNHILVIHGEWMSRRKLAEITYIDQDGSPQKTILDGSFKLSKQQKELGWEIDYFWINEVWEGTKIGQNIYVKIQPKANQNRSMNKLFNCKLGYTGGVYNSRNSRPTSCVDEMKPHQSLYNIILDKLEEDFNSELGQLLLMDVTQVPTQQGWDFEKWLYWVKKMKIVMIDPTQAASSHFNQFTNISATLGQSIQIKVDLLNILEIKCWQQAGFTPQRLGSVTSQETATATNAALTRSYNQTEDIFRLHDNIKARALTNLLEEAKNIYGMKSVEETFFMDDMSLAFIKIDGEKFTFSDLNVYITDSAKDQEQLQTLRQLAAPAIQSGTPLVDVVDIMTEDSISVIKEKLQSIKDLSNQLAQQKQQLEQQALEDKKQMMLQQQQWQSNENQKDREKDIYINELKVEASAAIQAGVDLNNNGEPDFLETSKLALQNLKISKDEQKDMRSHALKQEELKSKKDNMNKKIELENKKIQAIDHQSKNQEKMQNKDLAFKQKQLKSKEVIDRLKIKAQKSKKNNK